MIIYDKPVVKIKTHDQFERWLICGGHIFHGILVKKIRVILSADTLICGHV